MRATPTQAAIGLFVGAIVLGSGLGRLRDERRLASDRAPAAAVRFCIGVEHPEIRGGIACSDGPDGAIGRAVERLGLPGRCRRAALPGGARTGDRIALEGGGDRCALRRIGRLPGPARLLAGAKLDINRDPEAALALLPGIGPAKARRIVESRTNGGPFLSFGDLMRVPGIGEKTIRRLAPWLEDPQTRADGPN